MMIDVVREEMQKSAENVILAFHMGDFCEFFGKHAKEAGNAAGLIVTQRAGLMMFGLPWDDPERDNVFASIVSKGFTVIVYERKTSSAFDPASVLTYEMKKIIR